MLTSWQIGIAANAPGQFFADPLGRFIVLLAETHFLELSHRQLHCLPVDEPDRKLVVILFGWRRRNLRLILQNGQNQLCVGQMSACIGWHFDRYLRSQEPASRHAQRLI